MKKIITLILSTVFILIFSVTAFAEELLPSESSSAVSSSEISSEESSSSSEVPSSSVESSSSESLTSSEPIPEVVVPTIEIVSLPGKTVYELGETLDLNGLKVNITTSTGVIVSNNGANLKASATVLNTEGEQQITVSYEDLNAYFKVKVNPKHTHKFGAWEIEKEATCEQNGQKSRKCECGDIETVDIAKLGHDWDEGEIVIKATTEKEGQIKYSCTRCEEQKVEKTSKLVAETQNNQSTSGPKFKLTLKWWMIFIPVGIIIIGYIVALSIIFKKKV